MNLNLQPDEQIIISTGDVVWISDNGRKLDSFILTNQGLYCCYKEKAGLFSKAEDMVYRFELTDIIKEEECSHIEQVRARNERCIQIEFKHGMEHFSFQRVPKKIMDDWFAAFQNLLGVPDLTKIQKDRNKEMLSNLANDVMEGVGSLIGAGSRSLHDKIQQMAEASQNIDRNTGRTWTGNASRTERTRQTEYTYTYYEEGKDSQADVIDVEAQEISESYESREQKVEEKSIPVPPPIPQQDPYYLAIDGQPKGPFQIEEIEELARSGQINRATLAWTKGMDNWTAMEEIDGLRRVTENLPPVLK